MTWNDLVERESRLANLLWDVRAVKDDKTKKSFCANVTWFRQFKPRLPALVGWYCEQDDPVLRTQEAYEIAYRYLYHQLPDCRGCWCL